MGLIRSICEVKTVKIEIKKYWFPGGGTFSSTISAVKTVCLPEGHPFFSAYPQFKKKKKHFFYCVYRGALLFLLPHSGYGPFSFAISAVITAKIDSFFTIFTRGRFLFQYHIRDQNGKINVCSFCTVLIEGGKRVCVFFTF